MATYKVMYSLDVIHTINMKHHCLTMDTHLNEQSHPLLHNNYSTRSSYKTNNISFCV